MPKDAIFRAYSMTKPFVEVAAVMLMEEGRLQLTDPISKYLSEFKNEQVSVPSHDALGQAAQARRFPRNGSPPSRTDATAQPASPMAKSPPTSS